MIRYLQAARIAAVALGAVILAGLAAHLLLTPAAGTLLVLGSARQPDHLGGTPLALHSAAGWRSVDSLPARAVPAAPETAKLSELSVAADAYDSIRLGPHTYSVRLNIGKGLLTPLLIGVDGGRPMPSAIYAGTESVSLGLNELAGQLKSMPSFSLVDQFGRPFTNASVSGHDVVLAAFHTSCRETCPLVTGLFLQLRRQLPPSVLLLEATINPWEDGPEALRQYAGRIGASWTFLTGDPAALAAFWKPFDVELGTGDVHRSTLVLIDSHGYIRSYYLGAPDVGTSLPPELASQLSPAGMRLAGSHGNGWGQAQIVDSLQAIGGIASPSKSGEGQAPDFNLATLNGRKLGLKDFGGRPVLVNFWASYCVPCRAEMPLIERAAQRHPRLVVLLIDEVDDAGAARRFVADLHIRSTVLYDGDGKVGQLYGVSGLPTTVFVRPGGTIEGRYVGQTNEQVLASHLAALDA